MLFKKRSFNLKLSLIKGLGITQYINTNYDFATTIVKILLRDFQILKLTANMYMNITVVVLCCTIDFSDLQNLYCAG